MSGATKVLAVLAVLLGSLPLAIDAQEINRFAAEAMRKAGWGPKYTPITQETRQWFRDGLVFGENTRWETDDDCAAFGKRMRVFLNNTPMYYAQRWTATKSAEHIWVHSTPAKTDTLGSVVALYKRETDKGGKSLLENLLHEGAHWEGYGHSGSFTAYDAEACAKWRPLEEDDDEGDPNGGGDPVKPVCEEKLVAVYYTVYEREYRTGDTCLSSDDVDGADWCSGVGKWVKVRTTKVKWETQTVCSS